jgi:hypothetical protein
MDNAFTETGGVDYKSYQVAISNWNVSCYSKGCSLWLALDTWSIV